MDILLWADMYHLQEVKEMCMCVCVLRGWVEEVEEVEGEEGEEEGDNKKGGGGEVHTHTYTHRQGGQEGGGEGGKKDVSVSVRVRLPEVEGMSESLKEEILAFWVRVRGGSMGQKRKKKKEVEKEGGGGGGTNLGS
jgi:hypothetical protein